MKRKRDDSDITNKIFNRLTAIKFIGKNKHGQHVWKFQCQCGNELIISKGSVTGGNTKSCGCLQKEFRQSETNKKRLQTVNIGRKESSENHKKRVEKLKGLKRTPEQCETMRQARKGLPANPEGIAKMIATKRAGIGVQKGENHWAWKGGESRLSSKIKSHFNYTDWRNAVFGRDFYTCQDCGSHNGLGKAVYLHAHHIIYLSDIIEIYNIQTLDDAINCKFLWDTSNGLTLCIPCHMKLHRLYGRNNSGPKQ